MCAVQGRRWSRLEYDRMIHAGVFHFGERAELIDGEVISMTPQGSRHASAVCLAVEALEKAFPSGFHLRVQLPLALDNISEPEPDVSVVHGSPRDYRDAHPTSPVLVVEVSDDTLAFDRGVKAGVYARAGVPEYWIVNLREAVLEVHRAPTADAAASTGWRYADVARLAPDAHVPPLAAPAASVRVADLLP